MYFVRFFWEELRRFFIRLGHFGRNLQWVWEVSAFLGRCALLFLMVCSVVLKVKFAYLSAFLVGLCGSNLKECYSMSCIFLSISRLWIDVWRLWKQKVITSYYARARKGFSVRFCCRITSVNGYSFDALFAYSKKRVVVSSLLLDVGF